MKKITLLMGLFLFTAFSYSQSLPLDFSDPLDVFDGNEGSSSVIVTDPMGCSAAGCSGDVLQINGAGAQFSDPVTLSLTNYVDLSDSANNTITLDFYAASAGNLLVQFSEGAQLNGENGFPVEINAPVVVGLNSLVLDYDTASNGFPNGADPVTLDQYARIALFVDFGVANLSQVHFVDNISGGLDGGPILPSCTDGQQNGMETGVDCGGPDCGPCPVPPTEAAPTPPARDAGDVLSIFTPNGVYTDTPPSGVQTFSGATFVNFTVDTFEDTRLLTAGPGGGAQYGYFFGNGTGFDLTDFDAIHVDVWFEDAGDVGSVLTIQLQNFDSTSGAFQHNIFSNIAVNNEGSGAWVSADIDLDSFTNSSLSRDNIQQVQFIAQGPAFGPSYLTNMYFYKQPALANDNCATATVIDPSEFGQTISGTNVGATDSMTSGAPCVDGVDVWYSITAVEDGEINLTVDSGAVDYGFYSDCSGTLIGNCNTNIANATTGTTYYIRIGDEVNSRVLPGGFSFSVSGSALSNDSFDLLSNLKIYPNPTNDNWNIEGANVTIDTVEVFDILGKRVQTLSPNSSDVSIDASNFRTGLYLAKVYSGDSVTTIKLVKN